MSKLLLTPGEPAGVGPELVLKLAQENWPDGALIAVADAQLLARTAAALQLPLTLHDWLPGQAARSLPAGQVHVWHTPCAVTPQPGQLNPANADYVLETLRRAARACMDGSADAMVTGPVQKSVIADAGHAFTGHTEFLAELTGSKPVMMLIASSLRVALATTHLPLRDVPTTITTAGLIEILEILHADLRSKFGIAQPRILVCGLNPHAGESGHLGREEINIIQPALEALRTKMTLIGPLPADTLFTPKILENADAVLAMYHDQGLPVLKYAGFGSAVNITLGLPFIRTSVDHGTALDLAGTGRADAGSLRAAVNLARSLASRA